MPIRKLSHDQEVTIRATLLNDARKWAELGNKALDQGYTEKAKGRFENYNKALCAYRALKGTQHIFATVTEP